MNKQEFIKNTPKGTDFGFSNCLTGEHREDGTVFFNDQGCTLCWFDSIDDFADHYFDKKSVTYKEQYYVADRDDDDNITFLDTVYPYEELDLDDDGSNVFTKPVTVKN